MQTEVKEVGPCKLLIKIEIPQAKVKEKLDEKYLKFVDNTAVPGFRKGKAPRSFLERKYGKDINDEVKLDLISTSYEEVLKEKKLSPIADPAIDYEKIPFDQAKPLNFEFTVEVSPEIKLEKYTDIEVKKEVAKVTDAEV
ncbi:MAG: trigger factor family protein, partial [Planctomycetota bacterium]